MHLLCSNLSLLTTSVIAYLEYTNLYYHLAHMDSDDDNRYNQGSAAHQDHRAKVVPQSEPVIPIRDQKRWAQAMGIAPPPERTKRRRHRKRADLHQAAVVHSALQSQVDKRTQD